MKKNICFYSCLSFLLIYISSSAAIDLDPSGNPYPDGISSSHTDTIVQTEGKIFHISSQDTSNTANKIFEFDQFNLHQGESAIFYDQGVQNSIGCITGENISWINGNIQSRAQNFYLLNPNGIIFGNEASFDTSGASFVSTADYLQFSDGNTFQIKIKNAQDELLTVSSPSDFGFIQSDSPGKIEFNNCNLSFSNHVSIIGKNVYLNNSFIQTNNYDINIAALDQAGKIDIESKKINSIVKNTGWIKIYHGNDEYDNLSSSKNIWLAAGETDLNNSVLALYDESGDGKIQIESNNLNIQNALIASISIFGTSGDIKFNASDINIFSSGIINISFNEANSGHISIQCNEISILNESDLLVQSESGNTGKIDIKADKSINISDIYTIHNLSNDGISGNIEIAAPRITINNISGKMMNMGKTTGDIIISADEELSIDESWIDT
ncbi:secreted protein containing Filamentous hemagglutinin, partial [Candidatus Magnetomorum sp. HK-1]